MKPTPFAPRCRGWLATTLVLLPALAPAPMQAQVTRTPAADAAQKTPLKTAARSVRWNPARQGALLIVGGDVRARLSVPSAPTLGQLEARYDRKTARVGGVTALVPRTMSVLNTELPALTPGAAASFDKPLRLLLASLTPEQWRKIAAEGVGYGDLSRDQQSLWAGSVPDTVRRRDGGRGDLLNLTPEQVRGVRLRLHRALEWAPGTGSYQFGGGVGEPTPLTRLNPLGELFVVGPGTPPGKEAPVWGQTLLKTVPSAPKPSDLQGDTPALNATVNLSGIATVGDLTRRIARATGLELYSDPRYGGLPVTLRGTKARAGDLLDAICLSVTGTVRKVGPAYVVTDDVRGLAARHAALREWMENTSALVRRAESDLDRRLARANANHYLRYAPDDALAPTDAVAARLEDRARRQTPSWAPLAVPVAEFSPSGQAILRAEIERAKQYARSRPGAALNAVYADTVQIKTTARVVYDIPGVGTLAEVPHDALSPLGVTPALPRMQFGGMREQAALPLPPAPYLPPLETTPPTRALLVDARSDFARLAPEAARVGVTDLWVDVPGDSPAATKETLGRVVAAARPLGLRVRAVLPALRKAKPDPAAPLERTVQGETYAAFAAREAAAPRTVEPSVRTIWSDPWEATRPRLEVQELTRQAQRGEWLVPDSDAAREQVAARVGAAASVKGVSGIVLRDVLPPGFRPDEARELRRGGQWPELPGLLGYTEALRLRFLREESVDPLDLSVTGDQRTASVRTRYGYGHPVNLRLPFFPDEGTGATRSRVDGGTGIYLPTGDLLTRWARFRVEAGQAALQRLLQTARASAGDVPVLVYDAPVPVLGIPRRELAVESLDGPRAAPRAMVPVVNRGMSDFDPAYPNDTAAWKAIRSRSTVALAAREWVQDIHEWRQPTAEMRFGSLISSLLDSGPQWRTFSGWVLDLTRYDGDPSALLKALPSVGAGNAPTPAVPAAPASEGALR